MKNEDEVKSTLGLMLEHYEAYRSTLEMSPEDASKKIINDTYSDFYEWLTSDEISFGPDYER